MYWGGKRDSIWPRARLFRIKIGIRSVYDKYGASNSKR